MQVSRAWREAGLVSPGMKLKEVDFSPYLPLRDAAVALKLVRTRGTEAKAVNLGYIRLTEEVPLLKFVPFFSAERLRTLDVSAVTSKKWVDDRAIQALALRCPRLTRLNVFGCWKVTDEGLKVLSKNCPALQVLNLGSCSLITDDGIRAIANHCAQLLDLDLWRLEFVTDRSLSHLASKCVKLQKLVVSDCKAVAPQVLTNKFPAQCKLYF